MNDKDKVLIPAIRKLERLYKNRKLWNEFDDNFKGKSPYDMLRLKYKRSHPTSIFETLVLSNNFLTNKPDTHLASVYSNVFKKYLFGSEEIRRLVALFTLKFIAKYRYNKIFLKSSLKNFPHGKDEKDIAKWVVENWK